MIARTALPVDVPRQAANLGVRALDLRVKPLQTGIRMLAPLEVDI